MKILVLMPLDEKWSYVATELWKHLSDKAKENSFAMPMFTEWQLKTKKMVVGADLPPHWNVATMGSIIKAREIYKIQDSAKKDFILFGNISPDYKFDAIFNFQDTEEDKAYEDKYIEKLKAALGDDLAPYFNFYPSTASKMPLHNVEAAAAFLSAYIETDPHLDEIKAKYQETLKFKEDPHNA